jgi:hypothetical protein
LAEAAVTASDLYDGNVLGVVVHPSVANIKSTTAGSIVSRDRESHGRDLFESIERGDYPK